MHSPILSTSGNTGEISCHAIPYNHLLSPTGLFFFFFVSKGSKMYDQLICKSTIGGKANIFENLNHIEAKRVVKLFFLLLESLDLYCCVQLQTQMWIINLIVCPESLFYLLRFYYKRANTFPILDSYSPNPKSKSNSIWKVPYVLAHHTSMFIYKASNI